MFEIPEKYLSISDEEALARIKDIKRRLNKRLIILGHHYQRYEIIKLSDIIGDSFKLAKESSENKHAEYIVFCGVHFMAESAKILCGDEKKVFMPNPDAGCPMADMADLLDFISYLTLHIPDHYQHVRRYAGFYASTLQRNLPKSKANKKIIKEHKPIITLWAHLIAKIYGELPIICPKCGETMALSGFITRINDINIIVLWAKRAPPHKSFVSFDNLTDNISYDYFDDVI